MKLLMRIRLAVGREEGSVLVLVSGALMMLLLLGAIGIDAGWWFSHKREVQNEADAGALAAAVEYDQNWRACLNGDTTVAQNIANKARQYAGDPTYTAGALRNTQITEQGGSVLVNINKTGFDSGSGNDYPAGTPGMGSCYVHPGDSISPNGGVWTDVKVKESSAPIAFKMAGISSPDITAQARVQLNPALSVSKSSPLALPVPKLSGLQVRLYKICGSTFTLINKWNLTPLGSSHQTLGNETLWGVPNASGDNQSVSVSLPDASTCASAYARIGTEVRAVAPPLGVSDLDSVPCPSTNLQYEYCWTDNSGNGTRWGPETRVYAGQAPTTDPTFGDAHITSSTCSPDPYFSRVASCAADVALNITWPAACLTDTNVSHYSVKVTGGASNTAVTLTPPAGGGANGFWTTTGGQFTLGAGGADNFLVTWNGPSSCSTKSTGQGVQIHSTYVATDANSGIVELVRLTTTSTVDPSQGPVLDWDSVQSVGATNSSNVFLTVGVSTAFTVGPLLTLRLDSSQGNGSINCSNGSQGVGPTYDSFVNGCAPYYGPNNFATGFWWSGSPPQCPAPNTFPTNSSTSPWRCAPGAPGLSANQIANGVAMRVGACSYNPANLNGGCQSQTGITCSAYPNNWVAGQAPARTDKRLIEIFLVPYGAFNGQTGSSFSVPVIDLGFFYVTGWSGSSSQNDLDQCSGDDLPQDGSGRVAGHFVDIVDTNDNPDPTANCDPTQLRPCLATLVR